MNNQMTYPFFISKEFIDFLESIWIFSTYLRFWIFFCKFSIMIVTLRIFDVFAPRFHIIHKIFPGDWTNSCTLIASIFFQKLYFEKRKKKLKTFEWVLKNQ